MKSDPLQLRLPLAPAGFKKTSVKAAGSEPNALMNKLAPGDRAFHDWYRFVLSFPPHLVRCYLQEFELNSEQTILDPFCGTGTTLVESKKCGIRGVGLEANPFAKFASSVKLDWDIDPEILRTGAHEVADTPSGLFVRRGLRTITAFMGTTIVFP